MNDKARPPGRDNRIFPNTAKPRAISVYNLPLCNCPACIYRVQRDGMCPAHYILAHSDEAQPKNVGLALKIEGERKLRLRRDAS